MNSKSSAEDGKTTQLTTAETQEIVATEEKTSIDLSNTSLVDTTGLDDETINEIKKKEIDAKLDIEKKKQAAQIDLQGTKVQLDTLNDTVRDATREGTSATITHTQTTSVGRTEVVMGNTERAASGKMSRSAAGLPDNTMKLLIVGGVVLAVVALIVVMGK